MTATLAEGAGLPEVPDLAARLLRGEAPQSPGACCTLESSGWFAGFPVGDVHLVALNGAVWHPATGAVMTADGQLAAAPAAEVGSGRLTPALRALNRALAGRDVPRIDRAALWYPAGAANYGHFLFDALPGLEALSQRRLLSAFPALARPLTRWQAEALALAGYGAVPARPDAAVIRVGTLVYPTTLDHYLHRHGALMEVVLRRMQPQRPQLTAAGQAIYLARPGRSARVMIGEEALIAALTRQGVQVIDPAALSVAAQIDLFAQAHTIIGPSGAAFANMAFLPEGAKVIELRPRPMAGAWIGLTAARRGLRHRLIDAGPPIPLRALPWRTAASLLPRRVAGRYAYAYRIDADKVLAALSEA